MASPQPEHPEHPDPTKKRKDAPESPIHPSPSLSLPPPASKPIPSWKLAKAADYTQHHSDSLFTPVQPSGRIKWNITKLEFRARAHANPLSDGVFNVPLAPHTYIGDRHVQWLDIGCGYGGLVFELSTKFPHKHVMGMEIRNRVWKYCEYQLEILKRDYPGEYLHVSFERTNAQKYLTNFVEKGQLEHLSLCYPDPHWKKRKQRQRIVTPQLLAEYAYVLKEGGKLYMVTDVEELYDWMTKHADAFPLFERIHEFRDDVVASCVRNLTNEAARVEKYERPKFFACYKRKAVPSLFPSS